MLILDDSMVFLTWAGVSLALMSSLWCLRALENWISLGFLELFLNLPVSRKMGVVCWGWVGHWPGAPRHKFSLGAPRVLRVANCWSSYLLSINFLTSRWSSTWNRGGIDSKQGSPVRQLSYQSRPKAPDYYKNYLTLERNLLRTW